MSRVKALFALFGLACGVAVAQMPSVEARQRPDLRALLDLDAERASQVQSILEVAQKKVRSAHEEIGPANDDATRATLRAAMAAIRWDTNARLAAILTPEELAKLHAVVPMSAPPTPPMVFKRA